MNVFVARRKVVCMRRTIFHERVCGATKSGVYEGTTFHERVCGATKVLCIRRTTFHERVCGATKSGVYGANHIPRACLWRDEEWCAWSEPHSTGVFVARQEVCMKRASFHVLDFGGPTYLSGLTLDS